ncbi:ArsR/SmtB family transcription factor [Kitasatospora sp. NPDC127059]|uniref:ArsR/SmtB family transcription factor n=1 Tax=unclassified Kitasatospora TaxID=2633591 RepID=UPI00365626D1
MLELRFTVPDVARTRLTVSPLDQILGGTAGVQYRCVSATSVRDRWWRGARRHVPHRAAPFLELVNAGPGVLPDFLAVSIDSCHRRLVDELDVILAVTEDSLCQDLALYGNGPDLPAVVRDLRDGGPRRLRQVTDGIWALFRSCFASDWPDIQRALTADIAGLSRAAAEVGTGAMLEAVHPGAVWRADGVLRIPAHALHDRFALDGQGLELRPNFFLTSVAAALDGRQPAALLYPVRVPPPDPGTVRKADGLVLLVGATRARALRSIGLGPCTTTLLGERIGLSPASASAHATALRAAGAITTERVGTEVRHALTPLGQDLLLHNPEPVVSGLRRDGGG